MSRAGALDDSETSLLVTHFMDGGQCAFSQQTSSLTALDGPGSVFQVKLVRLVGIMLLLYVKAELALNISEVEVETVGTGIMGRMVRMATVHEKGEIWKSPRPWMQWLFLQLRAVAASKADSPIPMPAQGTARGNCQVLTNVQSCNH